MILAYEPGRKMFSWPLTVKKQNGCHSRVEINGSLRCPIPDLFFIDGPRSIPFDLGLSNPN
jgi:hypothetical protein